VKKCVILLAAGRGSRFRGPQQLTSVNARGQCLAELSIQDAADAGFDGAVLVVREDHVAIWSNKPWSVPVNFVVQPQPLGTGEALLRAQRRAAELGYSSWAVGNADDYYGPLWRTAAELADRSELSALAYPLDRVLSERGPVNRAVLKFDDRGFLNEIVESQGLTKADVGAMGNPLVSMNAWVLNQTVLTWWPEKLPAEGEFGIPDALAAGLALGAKISVHAAGDTWRGLTFPEDYADILAYFQRT